MSKSLKLTLGAMLAVAFLILFATFTSIGSDSSSASIDEQLGGSINLTQLGGIDTDNDGLNDSVEEAHGTDKLNPDTDGDGFLDGEEFLSGCDPLVVPPLDCSGARNGQNLTLLVTNRIAQGLVAGETFGETLSAEPVDALADEVDQQVRDAFTARFVEYTLNDLIIIEAADQGQVRHYIYNLRAIINQNVARSSYEITLSMQEGINYTLKFPSSENPHFADQAAIHREALRQLLALPVPRIFADDHLLLTNMVSDFSILYDAASTSNHDIVSGRLALNNMPGAFEHLTAILLNFSNHINAYQS